MQHIGVKDNVPKPFSGFSEGKTVAEVAALQERIPETIRLQRRHWELHQFESIKERSSLRPSQYTDLKLSGSNLRVVKD